MSSQIGRQKILQNDFSSLWREIRTVALDAIDRVGNSGWLILGREVDEFEAALARYWGIPHAIGCGNGMDALEISLRCMDLVPGQKVLTTPLSAFASTLAIVRAGGVPVFIDTDESGLIDLDLAERIIQKYRDIRVFLPVHLFGHSIQLRKMKALKESYHLKIVEDCAQAIGAQSFGQVVGSVGDCAATSFYPTKNLGCLGDGGALLTTSETIAVRARSLRNYGQTEKYVHSECGLNSRLDELQAALLRSALLPLLARHTQKRGDIAMRYRMEIQSPKLKMLKVPEGSASVWHLFPVLVNGDRTSFRNHLEKFGIATGIHYPKLINEQAALSASGAPVILSELTNAHYYIRHAVSLPIHPYMTDDDIQRVVDTSNSWQG